jgi:hypothetical protein
MFIDPQTISYKKISIDLIDSLLEVFSEFEEITKPWNKETFISKCNDAYQVILTTPYYNLTYLYIENASW